VSVTEEIVTGWGGQENTTVAVYERAAVGNLTGWGNTRMSKEVKFE
jgi:hypothetical protein